MELKILKQLQEKKLSLNGIIYKPYMIGNLPPSFGFIAEDDKEGTSKWFNYKGLTYIKA